MASVKALKWPGLTLPSGHRIAQGETLSTDNENLRMIDNARVLPALIAAGEIEVVYDPDPEPVATSSAEPAPEPVAEAAPIETPAEPAEAPARKK